MSQRPPNLTFWSPFALFSLIILFMALPTEGAPERQITYVRNLDQETHYQASQLTEMGKYQESIELLQTAVLIDRDNIDLYLLLAQNHQHLKEYSQAEDYYLIALDVEPNHKPSHERLGKFYLDLQKLDKAKESLAQLDKACWFSCPEYQSLKLSITAYERTKA